MTRTIGDPSTGTEAIPPESSASSSTSSSSTKAPPERRSLWSEEHLDGVVKPPRLELPKPRDFAIEETSIDAEEPASPLLGSSMLASPTPSPNITIETGMRVLVVDDDTLTRKLMSRMLTRLGCKVATAENGEVALDLVIHAGTRPTPSSEDTGSAGLSLDAGVAAGGEDRSYAIIFLDNQMPVMSGLETVAKLRAMGRRDLVVGVTGESSSFSSGARTTCTD